MVVIIIILGLLIGPMNTGLNTTIPASTARSTPWVDYIIIRDGQGGTGNPAGNITYAWVNNQNHTKENDWYYYAAGYNTSTGFVEDVYVQWELVNKNVGELLGDGNYSIFIPSSTGSTAIIARYYSAGNLISKDVTGVLSVYKHTIDNIVIHRSNSTNWIGDHNYYTDQIDKLYASGYNDTYGYEGRYAVNWTCSNPGICKISKAGYEKGLDFSGFIQGADLWAVGVGTCTITAELDGKTNTTGTLTVGPGINYIIIRDAPGNGGSVVGSRAFDVSETDTFYAAGYNTTQGYQSDINVNWNVDNNIGTITSSGISTLFSAWLPGSASVTCFITTLKGKLSNVTGVLTVNKTIDFIIIRDGPQGSGLPIGNMTISYNGSATFYAAGYNDSKGFISDVPVEWGVTNKYIGNMYGNKFYGGVPGSTAAFARYNPESASVIEGLTGVITVTYNKIDYIVIHTIGNYDWIGSKNYYPGQIEYLYAAGYNYSSGFEGDFAVNWTSSDPNISRIKPSKYDPDEISGGYPVKAKLWVMDEGTCQITAEIDGLTNSTGTIKVGPGIDYITIRDAPDNGGKEVGESVYTIRDTVTFYAAGYNLTKGYQNDVYVKWQIESDVGTITGRGSSATFTAVSPGSTIVSCYIENWMGEITNSTGIITVYNNQIDKIVIHNDPQGNGTWIGDRVYFEGNIDSFFVAGYNDTFGYEGEFAVTWTCSNTSVCIISRNEKNIKMAELETISVGKCTIQAKLAGGKINTTGKITVKHRLDYIIIRDAPNGGGKLVGNRTYDTDETETIYAAGYNNTYGYMDDVEAYWFSDSMDIVTLYPEVGATLSKTSSVTIQPLYGGKTKVHVYYYNNRHHPGQNYVYNSTGEIIVNPPPDITVDDNGSADYSTIQDAINAANPGAHIYVKEGIYNENIIVNKTLKITGAKNYKEIEMNNNTKQIPIDNKNDTIIDGGGTGIVVLITADYVHLRQLTIQNGAYGVYLNRSNGSSITRSIVKNYNIGIYSNHTNDCYIAFNFIVNGKMGILTNYAHNDAVRYNKIMNNTIYGAKDYNSDLKNCFNWNYFYNNKIGYWYDPTVELTELEFDGNILESNVIGVKVSDASTVRITNNAISDGDYGILIMNASPSISGNILKNHSIGIYCSESNSTIKNNTIIDSNIGIYSINSSPTLIKNAVNRSSEYDMYVENAGSIKIIDNNVTKISIYNSTVEELSSINTDITSFNATFLNVNSDSQTKLSIKWFLRVIVEDINGSFVSNATVIIQDIFGNEIKTLLTGSDGWTVPIALIEYVEDLNGLTYHSPHRVLAEKDNAKGEVTVKMDKDMSLIITIQDETSSPTITIDYPESPSEKGFPWFFIILFGSVIAAGIGGIFLTEVGKVALLSLFIPLYMKLKKEDILEHYDRGRVYQYIELNPGENYNSIKKAMDLKNGTLSYHLSVLEKTEIIKSQKDGMYKRFYPQEAKIPENNGSELTEVQTRIVNCVTDLPGIMQKELASMLGLRQSTISYQLTNLESKGYLVTTKKGKKTCYFRKE
jgi:DNA-binding MarR family transcriptional regulator